MGKRGPRRPNSQAQPKPPPPPDSTAIKANPFYELTNGTRDQNRRNARPPKAKASPVASAPTPPSTARAGSPAPPPPPDARVQDACALLEQGLVAQAYAALAAPGPLDAADAPPAPAPPTTEHLALIERLSGCVSRVRVALRAREWDAALREGDAARELWVGRGANGGRGSGAVPWEGKMWRCEALEGAKRWGELEGYASDLLKYKPVDRAMAQLYKATALYQQGKLDDTKHVLGGITSGDEETVEKVNALTSRLQRLSKLKDAGNAAFAAGRYDEAVAEYSHALLVDPENLQMRKLLYSNRGMAKMRLGRDLSAAVADFNSALTLSPRFVKALKHRAQAYAQQGRLDLALADLALACEAAPDGADRRALERERDEVRAKKREEEERRQREEEERRWVEKQAKRKDHYKILGVDRGATGVQIKSAYRKLSLVNHPDKGGDEEKFKEIKASYEILVDERKRRLYDDGEDDDPSSSSSFSHFHRHGHDSDEDYSDDDEFAFGGVPFVFEFLFGGYPHGFRFNDGGARGARGGGRGRGRGGRGRR
ncbi:hypothetical protein JCM3770_004982 [Rhodotorula araucariae]